MCRTSIDLGSFEVDETKALAIAEVLIGLHHNKHLLTFMPEYSLPRNLTPGSKEHALYTTYTVSIDYMTGAEKLWWNARGAYELSPEMFTPDTILSISNRTLKVFLRRLGARFISGAVNTWKKISSVIQQKYNGDPRNITGNGLKVEEIKERLRDFPYLRGSRLANFCIRVMGETGLFKVVDLDELDVPVDKQVARFTAYTGVIRLRTEKFQGCVNDDPLKSIIQAAWRKPAKGLGVAPWKLDEPIWNIGSKLCTKRRCDQCPVSAHCDKTKGITFKENTIIWEASK